MIGLQIDSFRNPGYFEVPSGFLLATESYVNQSLLIKIFLHFVILLIN
jgi:hypothetical protein